MASETIQGKSRGLDGIFRAPSYFWAGVIALCMPWVLLKVEPGTVYPLALGTGVGLTLLVLGKGGGLRMIPALLPGLLLGICISALAAWRGQWVMGTVVIGLTGLHFIWGAAAYRFAKGGFDAKPLGKACAILLGVSLAIGGLGWLMRTYWLPGCNFFNCGPAGSWPFQFTAGFDSPFQFLLFLIFLTPPIAVALVVVLEEYREGWGKWLLIIMVLLAGLGVIAGSGPLELVVVFLGLVLLGGVLKSSGDAGAGLLVNGSVFGFLLAMVFVYGVAPEYIDRVMLKDPNQAPLRLTLTEPLPERLYSRKSTTVEFKLLNTGWRRIGTDGENPFQIVVRVLIAPQQGPLRYHDLARAPLALTLAPGESGTASLTLRLPTWFQEGFLFWRLENLAGQPYRQKEDSDSGQRVINDDYHDLEFDRENRLSILTQRSRVFQAETRPIKTQTPSKLKFTAVIGSVLDTLFFSPLWGLESPLESKMNPFSPNRPFWPDLFRRYGFLGLMLAVWFGWRMFSHAAFIADRTTGLTRLGWRMFAISGALVAVIGLFSPALGTYHAHWALFLLAGFVEGAYARVRFSPEKTRNPAGALSMVMPGGCWMKKTR